MKDHRTDINTPQAADTPRVQIARRLQDAIEELHADVARVQLWASALTSFTQPIPDYGSSEKTELKRARQLAVHKAADKA
jgi:hypothetical protein